MTAADFVLLRVRILEAERNTLTESHTALVEAVEGMEPIPYQPSDRRYKKVLLLHADAWYRVQAALAKARKLGAES